MSVLSMTKGLEASMLLRLRKEQEDLQHFRQALVEEFLMDPQAFVQLHGKRPEDFTGADLRRLMC